jgi:hypothetical protein
VQATLLGGWLAVRSLLSLGHFAHQQQSHTFMPEHCVQVFLKLSSEHGSSEEIESIHEFTDELAEAIEQHEAGEFDGDEFGGGVCRLFMYGPDADKLFDAIKKPLLASPFSKGGHAIKRYGEASDMDSKEVRVDL